MCRNKCYSWWDAPFLSFFAGLLLLTGGLSMSNTSLPEAGSGQEKEIVIKSIHYNGWRDSYQISNSKAEIVVVPALGRVMQFRLAGEEGVFWENQELIGRKPQPQSPDWLNFGGDKTWPAPQTNWLQLTQRAWPPPPAFDSMPLSTSIIPGGVELVSPVDPHYGIQTRRQVILDSVDPRMTITTQYEKIEGKPVKVSIWVITQMKDPVGIFLPIPKGSIFPAGYSKQSTGIPQDLKVKDGLLYLTRGTQSNEKIGTDSDTLIWLGKKHILQIKSLRQPKTEYPDNGSSAEVYTNADPLPYIELETLGPLKTLKVGDKIEQTNYYTLRHRTSQDPWGDVRNILGMTR
jgi:hypothetical protein